MFFPTIVSIEAKRRAREILGIDQPRLQWTACDQRLRRLGIRLSGCRTGLERFDGRCAGAAAPGRAYGGRGVMGAVLGFAYPVTKALFEDGRKHLLYGDIIRSHCPVHILQGMQDPDVPGALVRAQLLGVAIDPGDITFFLGRETIIVTKRQGMAIWRERLFVLMARNAVRATAFFRLPPERVVELGVQVEM